MENVVWLCTFSEDTVVIEPRSCRYFCISECQRCVNGDVKVREGYQIWMIEGNEGPNETAGMEVSGLRTAERAVKRCQTFDRRTLRPASMAKNRMFHVESSVCRTSSLGLGLSRRRCQGSKGERRGMYTSTHSMLRCEWTCRKQLYCSRYTLCDRGPLYPWDQLLSFPNELT